MVLYSKFTNGSPFQGEKTVLIPLHGLQVTTISMIQKNSDVFLNTLNVKCLDN